jgi:hypothetical protein
MPLSASSVVVHSWRAAVRSNAGGVGPPAFLLLLEPPAASGLLCEDAERELARSPTGFWEEDGLRLPWESTDVRAACLARDWERESLESRRKEPVELTRWRDGRTSFFCLEAGRISSRSTGTPRETRKRRRIRERIQSGG